MPGKIASLVLPGSELEVKPMEDRREPLVLRISDVYPHGTSMRYDLVFYGLEPGSYDLAKYLRRKDGSQLGELPAIQVRVDPVLPPGQVVPHMPEFAPAPWLGGYRLLLGVVGSLWCAGLVAILVLGRRKQDSTIQAGDRPLTLADRLEPLVTLALEGTLTQGQHAELERLLLGYWRKRLNLERVSPAQAIPAMKEDPEAGPLIRQLEEWLHRPGPRDQAVDLEALLAPYRSLPAEAEELQPAAIQQRPKMPAGRGAR